jgi:CRP-like cAMP-binding protein
LATAADGLYLVGKGFVRLFTASGSNLATLGPGSVLGEDSLYRAVPYDVSAHAASDLEYWKLSDQDLRAIIVQHPAVGLEVEPELRQPDRADAGLPGAAVGQDAGTGRAAPPHLQAIADQLEPRKVAAGQVLYRAGDQASGIFLIESGRIEIQPDTADGERQEATAGRLLGALALLTAKPQTTTAVAREETLLWALLADDFQMIASRQPGLRRSLGRNVRARLSRTDQMQAVQRLSQMPIFAQLPPPRSRPSPSAWCFQHVPAGERVYRIGEVGDAMYLVETARLN